MRRIYYLVLFIVLCQGSAFAQKTWSFQDCVEYAIEHNVTVRQSEIAAAQKEIQLNTAESNRLPSLSGSVSQNFSFGRGLTADNTYSNSNTTTTGMNLGTDIPVFMGLRIKNNIIASKLNLAAAVADLEKAREDVSIAVAQAYVQILYDEEIMAVAERQVQIDSLQHVRIAELARNGKASESEVAAQEATLAQSRSNLTEARGTMAMDILNLTQLIQYPSPEDFSVKSLSIDSFDIRLLTPPELLYQEAESTKASIAAEQTRLESALTSVKIAKGAYYPSLSLSGGIGTNYYTSSIKSSASFFEQMKNNFSQYIGLSLSVPIFNRNSTRNDVRSAQLSVKSQELTLENAKQSLYKDIQQAYYRALNCQDKYVSAQSSENSAAKAFELSSARYEAGKDNSTTFNEAKARYLEASSNLARARYEYIFQTAVLDFYAGRQLVLP